jgi:predicted nucleic-acid-binding Zn-ribbon protein
VSKHLYAEISCDYCGYAEHFNADRAPKGFRRVYSV